MDPLAARAAAACDSVRPPVVVVVDDDTHICMALAWLLRSAGLCAATFPSAEALLAPDLGEPPLCLILDIHLSGMSGLDLIREIERLRHVAHAGDVLDLCRKFPAIVGRCERNPRIPQGEAVL